MRIATTLRGLIIALAVLAGASALPGIVLAQTAEAPPALKAALAAGNSDAVRQAILTLSAGDPAKAAALADIAVKAAYDMLATNPKAAIQIAAVTVNMIKPSNVQSAAPQQSLDVALIASKIALSPAAMAAMPDTAGAIGIAVAAVAANPAVYATSPATAIQVMSNAYDTVGNVTVSSASPGAVQAVVAILNEASKMQSLAAANPDNTPQIAAILARPITGFSLKTDNGGNYTAIHTGGSLQEENTLQSGSAS